jgi:serine/threonine protein phosphatase PrpC
VVISVISIVVYICGLGRKRKKDNGSLNMFCFFCVCDGMGEMEMGKIEWWVILSDIIARYEFRRDEEGIACVVLMW